MAANKTQLTDVSVENFLNSVKDEEKRKDSFKILELMKKVSGQEPKMWGPSIVGFGSYHYKYESGHEGDICMIGFSPKKQNFSLYITCELKHYEELLKKLGKHKTGVSCLYIKRLSDVDINILEKMIQQSYSYMKNKYSTAGKN